MCKEDLNHIHFVYMGEMEKCTSLHHCITWSKFHFLSCVTFFTFMIANSIDVVGIKKLSKLFKMMKSRAYISYKVKMSNIAVNFLNWHVMSLKVHVIQAVKPSNETFIIYIFHTLYLNTKFNALCY